MSIYKETWPLKLKNMIPETAYGFSTCMYAMSLEAWRRGLEINFSLKRSKSLFSGISYTISDGNTLRFFNGSRGDISTKQAIAICANKGKTNKYLALSNVPIPIGKSFLKNESNEDLLKAANDIGYPLVLKPVIGGGGAGVITNIKNSTELEKHIYSLRNRLSKKSVVIEKFFVGEDFRINVLDGKVIGAFHRRALSVLGDGVSSIQHLLKLRNEERSASPFLHGKSIKMDRKMINYLTEQGMSKEYIPKRDERVYLRKNGEFFGQRDSIDYTDKLSPEMKSIAIKAVEAIPGLKYGGVDMLIDLEKNEGVVNEVNSKPQIGNHLFPIEGEYVDIPKIILDYYFPHTKTIETENTNYYYDFKPVIDNFRNGTAAEIKIPSVPDAECICRQFLINGENLSTRFLNRLKAEANNLAINGFVKVKDDNNIEVIASGNAENLNQMIYKTKNHPFKKTYIKNIVEEEYKGPIKIGFEIKDN